MPYIPEKDRSEIMQMGDFKRYPKTAGELNYLITTLILDYIYANKLSYQVINDIVGALEGAKLEFYRRTVAKYENEKIKENGDVY